MVLSTKDRSIALSEFEFVTIEPALCKWSTLTISGVRFVVLDRESGFVWKSPLNRMRFHVGAQE